MSRKDGKWAKYIYPMLQMTPHIMPHRWDSANYARADVRCDYLDRFIANQAEKGEHFTYNDILIAAIVRMYSERIQMNRFVVGNKIYDRYDLTIAFAVKKVLKDNASETVVKVNFDGSESIFDVRDKLKAAFEDNSGSKVNNDLDLFMNKLLKLPAWLLRFFMSCVRWADRHNILAGSLVELSPFHNSCFVTFLKSIKCDFIYHHVYEFGTTGLFVAMGKEKKAAIVNEANEIIPGKVMTVGLTMDERIADGLYYANTLRYFTTLMSRPEMLLKRTEPKFTKELVNERHDRLMAENRQYMREIKERLKREKKERKAAKKHK